MATGANIGQAEFWNGEVGRRWARYEDDLDLLMQDISGHLAAQAQPGQCVLEIGCGSGGLSVALAQAVGDAGEVLALDISEPLLDRARQRAAGFAKLQFRLDDAQTAVLPNAHFDLVVSQFGAMFFADPAAAFNNLRPAMKSGARIVMAAWAPVSENPFFLVPRQAALTRLGTPPAGSAVDGPGPFAFASIEKVVHILKSTGFADAVGRATAFTLRHPDGIAPVAEFLTRLGPAAGLLREMNGTEADRQAINDSIRTGLQAYASSSGAEIPSSINIFTATSP